MKHGPYNVKLQEVHIREWGVRTENCVCVCVCACARALLKGSGFKE